jgi:cytochrome oxidase Cu insertion factor (SCO1/SenC/PrrC family)
MTLPRAVPAILLLTVLATPAAAQMKEDPEFVKKAPTVGDPFPEVTVYTTDGKEFKTADLRKQYTVVAFGCLT